MQSEILILLKDLAKRRKQRRKFFYVCKDSLKEAVRDSLLGFLGLAIFRYIIEERSTNGKQLLSRKTQNITSVAISLWNFNICCFILLHWTRDIFLERFFTLLTRIIFLLEIQLSKRIIHIHIRIHIRLKINYDQKSIILCLKVQRTNVGRWRTKKLLVRRQYAFYHFFQLPPTIYLYEWAWNEYFRDLLRRRR